jgi:diaminopimelate epimerase
MPNGANVNFIKVIGNEIEMRTYERGVERETLACGTGALSSGIIAFAVKNVIPPVNIRMRSGEYLSVDFKHESGEIGSLSLTGGAVRI